MDKEITTEDLEVLQASLVVCDKFKTKRDFQLQLKGGPLHRSMRQLGLEWLRRKQVSEHRVYTTRATSPSQHACEHAVPIQNAQWRQDTCCFVSARMCVGITTAHTLPTNIVAMSCFLKQTAVFMKV